MVNVEAFKAHMRGMAKPETAPATEPDGAEPDGDESGLSPGDQAIKAIKAGDGAAFEEAVKRCLNQ